MDLPLLLKAEIHELANGVVLTISNDGRPTHRDPLGQTAVKVGPLHFENVETALDSVPRLAREALEKQKEREDGLMTLIRRAGRPIGGETQGGAEGK